MNLRRHRKSDLPHIREIFAANRGPDAGWLNPDRLPDDLDQQILGETIIVAESKGKVVGFASIWEPEGFIHHLYVHPSHQRKGIGSDLVREAARICPGGLTLKCVRANERAMAFYLKTGWTEVGAGSGEDGEYAVLELSDAGQFKESNLPARTRGARIRVLHAGLWTGVFFSFLCFGLHSMFSTGMIGFSQSRWKGPGVESGEAFFLGFGALGLVFIVPELKESWKRYRSLVRLRHADKVGHQGRSVAGKDSSGRT